MLSNYADQTIKLRIPTKVIQSLEAHPEPYGDHIAILVNGMYTDVYKDHLGYYTLTNDQDLIDYIQGELHKHA